MSEHNGLDHELDKRVSVLEVEFKNVKETVEENRDLTLQIKERLDKQNGLIPHMADSVKSLVDVQQEMMKKLNANDIQDAKDGAKMKVLWAAAGTIGAAILGYVLKSVLG
jgi:plasmid maintenance system antidote protein VapI